MSTKKHCLIIGAGQLGSRHLQAIAKSSIDSRISVVDPSTQSLEIAKQRFTEVMTPELSKEIYYYKQLSEVKGSVDFCVLATSAQYRLAILKELLNSQKLRYIVLEKVVFQSAEQLKEAESMLTVSGVQAWVNCPRRMFPLYQDLRKRLKNEKNIKLKVTGKNWGLACNAIHMIDLWAYLTGAISYQCDMSGLDPIITDSKRSGYKEISGLVCGSNSGHSFYLNCEINEGPISMQIAIESEDYEIAIDESKKFCKIINVKNKKEELIAFDVLYQSQLTHLVYEQLLAEGECELTPYAVSAHLHEPFLKALLDFFNEVGSDTYAVCPIT